MMLYEKVIQIWSLPISVKKNGQIWLYEKLFLLKKEHSTKYSRNIPWNIPQNILRNIPQVANHRAPRGQPGGCHVAPRWIEISFAFQKFVCGRVWNWVTAETVQWPDRWVIVAVLDIRGRELIFKCDFWFGRAQKGASPLRMEPTTQNHDIKESARNKIPAVKLFGMWR